MKLRIIFALVYLASASVAPSQSTNSSNFLIPQGRISRGLSARDKQFPYQVGLILKDSEGDLNWCGGSLLNNEWVLTAAHCTDGTVEIVVTLGSTYRSVAEVVHKINSTNIIIHPGWNAKNVENDISLIKIPYTPYSDAIKPVRLPPIRKSYSDHAGKSVIASGWGRITDAVPDTAEQLQWGRMKIIPNEECTKAYDLKISNICGSTSGGASTCRGDSGGPLILESYRVQIGLTSFGSPKGCEKGIPVVFTRLTSYLPWIRNIMANF